MGTGAQTLEPFSTTFQGILAAGMEAGSQTSAYMG